MEDVDSQSITINLSSRDRLRLSEIEGLATGKTNSYLVMTAEAFDDYTGADVIAITNGNALYG